MNEQPPIEQVRVHKIMRVVALSHDVREFHREKTACADPRGPINLPDFKMLQSRRRLIDEEVNDELLKALDSLMSERMAGGTCSVEALAHVAHEAVDAIYVIVGTLTRLGISIEPIWDLVHAANKRKSHTPDGKVRKPVGWTPADVAKEILRQHDAEVVLRKQEAEAAQRKHDELQRAQDAGGRGVGGQAEAGHVFVGKPQVLSSSGRPRPAEPGEG